MRCRGALLRPALPGLVGGRQLLETTVAQEMRDLGRDIHCEQHADMAVSQHDVVVKPGNEGLAHGHGAVVFLVKMREKLTRANST